MEVYKCALCPTNRRPTDKHQTFIKIHSLPLTNTYPCFVLGASTDPVPVETDLHFCVFRHQEDWQTDYNVQLDKKVMRQANRWKVPCSTCTRNSTIRTRSIQTMTALFSFTKDLSPANIRTMTGSPGTPRHRFCGMISAK